MGSKLGIELTLVLCMAMICATVLAALGKLDVQALMPLFSGVITGGFALAMPARQAPVVEPGGDK